MRARGENIRNANYGFLQHGFYEWTLCVWQLLWPDKYWDANYPVKRSPDDEVIAWMGPGTTESAETPLLPFKIKSPKKKGLIPKKTQITDRYWNAARSRYWEDFGYSKPESCKSR